MRGETPFLHVFAGNPARDFYVRLGFREPTKLWVVWRRPRWAAKRDRAGPDEARQDGPSAKRSIERYFEKPSGASQATVPISAGMESSRISSSSEVPVSLCFMPPGI